MKDTNEKEINEYVDFHIHSKASIDGSKSINSLLRIAHKNNVSMLGITDHNTISGVNNFLDKENFNRLDSICMVNGKTALFPGVEITVRISSIKNNKGAPVKLHLVAYGIDRTDESPISQLIKIKGINDKHIDYGYITEIEKKYGIIISDQDLLEYSIFCKNNNHIIKGYSKQETFDFCHFMNFHLTENDAQLQAVINSLPQSDRLNLEAKDVINLVHASGGIVLLAHPHLSLQRTPYANDVIDYLVQNEIDGFELYYPQHTKSCDVFLRKVCKDNNITLFSGGTDYHQDFTDYDSKTHVSYEPISSNKVAAFIDYMNDLNYAHQKGTLITKNYKNLKDFNIEETLNKYRRLFCICEHI